MINICAGKYTVSDIEHFILFRARGWGYDRISKFMNVSKPTLIKWQEWLDDNSPPLIIDINEFTPLFEKRERLTRKLYIAVSKEIIKRMEHGIDDNIAGYVIGAVCHKKKNMSRSIYMP